MIAAMTALLALLPAPARAEGNLLTTTDRMYVTSSVQLPRFMWFLSDFNREIRVSGFDVELVLACEEIEARRTTEVRCLVEQAALRASPLAADVKWAPPVLTQMQEKLEGATVVLLVRADGRITNVNLRDAWTEDARHRRMRQMNENLRLVVARAVAGLDLQRPREPLADGVIWAQRQTLMTMAPSAFGTLGATEMILRATPGPDDLITVRAEGTAMIAPASTMNDGAPSDTYDTRVIAQAIVAPDSGRIQSVAWTVIGVPTASSAIAEGMAGIPYVQQGRAVGLAPGERGTVGETGVMAPKGPQPSVLQQNEPLGVAR